MTIVACMSLTDLTVDGCVCSRLRDRHCMDQIHVRAAPPGYDFTVAFSRTSVAATTLFCRILDWMAQESIQGRYIDHAGWPKRAVFTTQAGAMAFKMRWC